MHVRAGHRAGGGCRRLGQDHRPGRGSGRLRHRRLRGGGDSTSGQAARTLSREAGIDSRTLASLNWRIAHNRLQLSARHVAVLDEAAMTDDAALAAFL